MNAIERLRQYLMKASFSSASDKFSALECLAEIERAIAGEETCGPGEIGSLGTSAQRLKLTGPAAAKQKQEQP